MKTITKEFKVYDFSELSDESKEKAKGDLKENLDIDFSLEDEIRNLTEEIKKNLKLNFSFRDFDYEILGRSNHLSLSSWDILRALRGKYPNLYVLDIPEKFGVYTNYLGGGLCSGSNLSEIGDNVITLENDDEAEAEADDLKRNITRIAIKEDLEKLQELMKIDFENLYKNYEYATSDEAIVELIDINEYKFLEDGSRF